MKYLCTHCNYTYDKSTWDKEEDVEVWIELEKCPICEEYDTFQGIEEEVNYIDTDDIGVLESDHMPVFNFKDDKLEVRVWREAHVMWDDHRISSVWLYDEYGDLVEEKYIWVDEEWNIVFDVSDLDEWEVRIKCTQHWIWSRKFEND